jgi:hypothetical protein
MRCAAPPLIGASRCLLLLLSPLSVRRAHRNLAGSSTLVAFHRGHGHDGYPYSEPVITVVEYDPGWPEHFEMLRNEYAAAMAGAGSRSLRSNMSEARPFTVWRPSPSSTVTSWSARPT